MPFVEPDWPLDREPVLLLAVSDIAWSIICPPRARSGRKYLTWPSASRARSIALMVEFWLALAPGGYKVTTDERGGGWRGRVVRMVGEDGEVHRVLSVRTWLG